MNSKATDHITGELEKLSICDKYMGGDQVHASNGAGMEIHHVGHSILHSPTSYLHLKNILHVPKASKNLISINRFVMITMHTLNPDCFLVKEQQ